mgnify:CR=1 FL=1
MALIASDRKILIVGLGQSGLSCARFLHAQGRTFAVADSRENPPGLDVLRSEVPDVEVRCGEFDMQWFCQFNELLVSPGVSVKTPAVAVAMESGAAIRGDIDLFAEHAEAPILAITGSNGKTTVTALVGDMARKAGVDVAVGGNIGTPALDLLSRKAELYVLEVSSFQLETTASLGARAATILNISDDHMDRYDSRMAYYQAKQRIYNGAQVAVVNLDDALSTPMTPGKMEFLCFGHHRVNPDTFSTREDEDGLWITWGLDNLINTRELRLVGLHNVSNVMAALALGHAAGLPMPAMLDAAREFSGLPHRCERVAIIDQVEYINDSKGTNVGATVAAINSLAGADRKLVLIAGGEGKGADFDPLLEPVRRHCHAVILIGRDAALIAEALEDSVTLIHSQSLADALQSARQAAEPGDRVLFSPACASFDMFRDYKDRGEQFAQLAGGLES